MRAARHFVLSACAVAGGLQAARRLRGLMQLAQKMRNKHLFALMFRAQKAVD